MPGTVDELVSPATWNLFLSSTVRDFKDYRRAIRDACFHKAQTACLLSEEDWPGGYDDTVAKCEERVKMANAFLLLVGHWYGSVPPGRDRSITHIEFDGALKRWQASKFPPMAVMMPKPGSAADKQLQNAALSILKKEGIDATKHEKSLTTFRAAVTGSWRTVTPFKDRHDLREHAIARCWEWRGRTPLAAAQGQVTPEPSEAAASQVMDEQLGALGRELHLKAVRSALARVVDYPDVPGVAMIVFGDDDAGQRAFLQRLLTTALKNYYPKRRLARLPVENTDPAILSSWIAHALSVADSSGVQTPEQLAARVAPELKRQPLYFVLDRVADLAGGVAAFRETFWLPFYRELHVLRAAQQFTHRLVAIVADYSGKPLAWESVTCTPDSKDGPPDYTRLLRIPRLGRFNRDDLLTWFDEMEIMDEPAGHRSRLANRVMKNSRGKEDPIPIRVFERLRGETLWPGTRE